MTDLRLQKQDDESALQTLLDRFFAAVDANSWPEAEACLATSVVLDLRIYGGGEGPQLETPADFILETRQRLGEVPQVEHRATSPRFTVDGPSALGQAHARVRFHTPHRLLTRYADLSCRFLHEHGRWVIQRLEFAPVRDEGDLSLLGLSLPG